MTDTRIPSRWMGEVRFRRLSHREFRSYVVALAWSVSERSEGVIRPDDLRLIVDFDTDSITAFVGAGLWRKIRAGWLIVDFDETQTTKAELDAIDARRAVDRDRKRRARAAERAAALAASTSTDDAVQLDVRGTPKRTSAETSEVVSEISPHAALKAKDKDNGARTRSTTAEAFSKRTAAAVIRQTVGRPGCWSTTPPATPAPAKPGWTVLRSPSRRCAPGRRWPSLT